MKYDIRADIAKNRLYMVLDGFFTDDEMKEAADKVIEEIDKLRARFDIINDISTYMPASQEGAQEIVRGQKHAEAKGVSRIVRITSKSVIGAM